MSVFRRSIQILSVMPALFLAGCGDGWEMQPYHGVPYDGERTAGSGVEYVLAKMAPTKGAVLEPEMKKVEEPAEEVAPAPVVEPEAPPPVVEEPELKSADELFDKKVHK